MGVKNDLMLSNTIPVIDSDYYDNENNEGNIGISIRNLKPSMRLKGIKSYFVGEHGQINVPEIEDLTEENTVIIKAGDRVAQGFFVKYLPSDNCNSDEERKGGFGSTTK
jgi:dUTP pyrophosphatase